MHTLRSVSENSRFYEAVYSASTKSSLHQKEIQPREGREHNLVLWTESTLELLVSLRAWVR